MNSNKYEYKTEKSSANFDQTLNILWHSDFTQIVLLEPGWKYAIVALIGNSSKKWTIALEFVLL